MNILTIEGSLLTRSNLDRLYFFNMTNLVISPSENLLGTAINLMSSFVNWADIFAPRQSMSARLFRR
jgi:hypothetical protein